MPIIKIEAINITITNAVNTMIYLLFFCLYFSF